MFGKKKKISVNDLKKLEDKARNALGRGKDTKSIEVNQRIIQYGRELGEEGIGHVAGAHFRLGGSALGDKEYGQARRQYNAALKIYEKLGDLKHAGSTRSRLRRIPNRGSLLERAGLVTAIIGFLGSVFFISNNFTGYTIAEINQQSSNLFGVVLFLIGIVGLYFWTSRR